MRYTVYVIVRTAVRSVRDVQEVEDDWLELFRRQQHVHAQERLIDRLTTPLYCTSVPRDRVSSLILYTLQL